MNKIKYLLFLCLFAACAKDNCQETYYFSKNEKDFIAYGCNDSITVTYTSNNNTQNWTERFRATRCFYDTVKQHDALGINPCANYFERIILEFYSSNYIEGLSTTEGHDFIWFNMTSDNAEFNSSIYFGNSNLSYKIASDFSYSPLTIDDNKVYFLDIIEIDDNYYSSVYIMIDKTKEVFDSLYYSPNYGLIKLITEDGTYTFENLN